MKYSRHLINPHAPRQYGYVWHVTTYQKQEQAQARFNKVASTIAFIILLGIIILLGRSQLDSRITYKCNTLHWNCK